MDDLIKALKIFRKYMDKDVYKPTHCEHDSLFVCCVPFEKVSVEDVAALDSLGFHWCESNNVWESFRFGSC